MSDTEPKDSQGAETKPDLNNYENAKDFLKKFYWSGKRYDKNLKPEDFEDLEKGFNTLADGLESENLFYESSAQLILFAEFAPKEDETPHADKLTPQNHFGLLALKAMADHSEGIKKYIFDDETNNHLRQATIVTVTLLERKTDLIDPEIKMKALQILRTKDSANKTILNKSRLDPRLTDVYSIYQPNEFNGVLEEIVQNKEGNKVDAQINDILELTTTDTFEKTRIFLEKLISQKYRFSDSESADLITAWIASADKDKQISASLTKSNIKAMGELESWEPGSVLCLSQKFGISCFARYPVKMLVEQYRFREDKESPYGLVIYPYGDNSIFYQDKDVLDKFFGQLQTINQPENKHYRVRIYEAKNLFYAGQDLLRAFNDYGRVHFALVGGHGSPEEVWFGHGESLSKNNIQTGKGVQRFAKYFIPDNTIVLLSCSTGKEGGVAEELSKYSKGKVIAPNNDTVVFEISVKPEGGKLSFGMQYRAGTKMMVYESGKLLNNQ